MIAYIPTVLVIGCIVVSIPFSLKVCRSITLLWLICLCGTTLCLCGLWVGATLAPVVISSVMDLSGIAKCYDTIFKSFVYLTVSSHLSKYKHAVYQFNNISNSVSILVKVRMKLPNSHSWFSKFMSMWLCICRPGLHCRQGANYMMTSSNGNIFRVTGHLWGEFTGHRWILRTKASDAELWCFLWSE